MSHAILVTGCHRELRREDTVPLLWGVLDKIVSEHPNEQIVLIEGEATGVDTWAREWADDRNLLSVHNGPRIIVEKFPMSDFYRVCKTCNGAGCPTCGDKGKFFAPWAGPNRNKAMVKRGLQFQTRECVGVWDWTSRGTWGCMTLAHGAGYPLLLLDMKHGVLNSWASGSANAGQFLLKNEPPRRRRGNR